MDKLYQDRDWLYQQYVAEEKSTCKISKEIHVAKATIWKWLNRHNIQTRSRSEAFHIARRHSVDISQYLMSIIEGELLGDGSMAVAKYGLSARYKHGSKHLKYLEWLSGEMKNNGIMQTGRILHRIHPLMNNCETWHYTSLFYTEFLDIRNRFYPNGIKIVPGDIVLNQINLRQFFIGDGSLIHDDRSDNIRPYAVISTYAFDKRSMDTLINQLKGLGFLASIMTDNRIRIGARSTKDFIEYISPCPAAIEDIYGYKFSYDGSIRYKKNP